MNTDIVLIWRPIIEDYGPDVGGASYQERMWGAGETRGLRRGMDADGEAVGNWRGKEKS